MRAWLRRRFAEHDGRDYLIVIEGGTKLKIYEIKDSRPERLARLLA